jgi:glycosyltransferase involved in cell wall biosynthesis
VKIAHLINSLDSFGGAETHLIALADAQRRAGDSVALFVLQGATSRPGAFEHRPRCLEIPARYWAAPRRIAMFGSLLRRERFDVLNCHLPRSSAVGRLASLASPKTAVVLTEQNVSTSRGRLGRHVHRLLQDRVDAVIAVSEPVAADAEILVPMLHGRIHVVPNCLAPAWFTAGSAREETRRALGIAQATRVAICISRFVLHKGHNTLIRAFADAAIAVPQALLLLVGDGPTRRSSEQLAKELGLAEHVRFLGRRADTRQLLDASDLSVLASRWEGLPLTLLEAQARGRPVVCTGSRGSASAVEAGETALITPIEDEGALAAALIRVLLDPALGKRLGEKGRRRARSRFASDAVAAETAGAYEAARSRRLARRPAILER